MVVSKASNYIADPSVSEKDKEFWNEALNFYKEHPVIDASSIKQHANYVGAAGGYEYDPSAPEVAEFDSRQTKDSLFHSHYNPINALFVTQWFTLNVMDIWNLDYSPAMTNIRIPSLILWGAHDGILPVAMATNAYDSLGTQSSNKSMVIFDKSGHDPMLEERTLFVQSVSNFIENYK